MGFLLSIDDLDGQCQCLLCREWMNIDYSNQYENICTKCDLKLEYEELLYNKLMNK